MQALAEATGGEANFTTKSLNEAVEEALGRGSHYYTLTFAPTGQRQYASYRKILVDVARPGLTLEYRHCYFAGDPNPPPHPSEAEPSGEGQAPPHDPMHTAMMLGSPDPTEIILSALVRPASAVPEPVVATGNTLVGTAKGPFRRYTVLIRYRREPRSLPRRSRRCPPMRAANGNLPLRCRRRACEFGYR